MKSGRQRRPRAQIGSSFEALIEQARGNQTWAATVLYENHVAMVHGYFRACGVHEPDDLTSEVFVGMLGSIGRFTGDHGDFRRWLMTIAHRRLVDFRRRSSVSPIDYVDPVSLDAAEHSTAIVDLPALTVDRDLIVAFRHLTEAQREVLALRFIADLSVDGVAAIVGRPVTAVKSLQHRGLEAVKRELAPRRPASAAGA